MSIQSLLLAMRGTVYHGDLFGASYSGKSLSVSAQIPGTLGIFTSADGTKIYVVGSNAIVFQYGMSTIDDLSTATYSGKSISVAGEISGGMIATAMAMSPDGLKLYVSASNLSSSSIIYQYTLSTAWDISTASYASKSLNITAQTIAASGVTLSLDGAKLYITTDDTFTPVNPTVHEYNLSTLFDISTGSYSGKSFNVFAQTNTHSRGVRISPDGLRMYVDGSPGTCAVFQYNLSTPFDVSTASYKGVSLSVNAQDYDMRDFVLNVDGTKLYAVGGVSPSVYQYNLL